MSHVLKGFYDSTKSVLLPVGGVLLLLSAWQFMATMVVVSSGLPTAIETLWRLVEIAASAEFWKAAGQTAISAGIGFGIAVMIAIPLGILIGISELFYRASRVLLEFVKPIPSIVVLPLVVLVVGINSTMAEVLVVFSVVPTLVVVVAAGARDTDPTLLDTGRSYRYTWLRRQRQIVLPSAIPFIVTGARISVSAALMTAVMAEIVGGAPGLGAVLESYRRINAADFVFAYVVAIGILGVLINYSMFSVEKWLLRARPPVSDEPVDSRAAKNARQKSGALAPSPWIDPVADRASVLYAKWRERTPSELRVKLTTRAKRFVIPSKVKGWLLFGVQVSVPVILLIWWWIGSAASTNPNFPSAQSIAARFQEIWLFDHFVSDVLPSLRNLVLGFGIAVVVGIFVGVLAGRVAWIGSMAEPIIGFFRSIPGVAFVPIMVTLLGFGTPMRVSSIALASTFPVLLATLDGIRSVDSNLVDVAKSYRMGWLKSIRNIYLPNAAPRIFAGLEVSLVIALVVMITSELMGTLHGIGSMTLAAQQTFDMTGMWAGILLLAFLGLFSNMIFRFVRHFVLRWYDGARRVSRAQ